MNDFISYDIEIILFQRVDLTTFGSGTKDLFEIFEELHNSPIVAQLKRENTRDLELR